MSIVPTHEGEHPMTRDRSRIWHATASLSTNLTHNPVPLTCSSHSIRVISMHSIHSIHSMQLNAVVSPSSKKFQTVPFECAPFSVRRTQWCHRIANSYTIVKIEVLVVASSKNEVAKRIAKRHSH